MSRPRWSRVSAVVAASARCCGGPSLGPDRYPHGQAVQWLGDGSAPIGTPDTLVKVHAEWTAATAERPAMLSVTADIEPPWHTYSITPQEHASPTEITIEPSSDYQLSGDFRPIHPPEKLLDKTGQTFEIHTGTITWQAPWCLARASIRPT